jgi:hypothetical protein
MVALLLMLPFPTFGEGLEPQEPTILIDREVHFKYTNPYIDWPELRPERMPLVEKMAKGFVKKIEKESHRWYNCGIATPRRHWERRATYMTSHVVAAMDYYGMKKVSPWGAMAVVFKESRGNPCTPGPHPRKYARELGLIEADKTIQQWTTQDTTRVMTHPKWKGRMADLGIGQNVWKRWSRVCDERTCNRSQQRIPSLEEMLSVEGSAKVMVWGFRLRQRGHSKRWWTTPWVFWPGNQPRRDYARKLARIVQDMGGPADDVLNWRE